jgi:NAD(P)-dependent dehydrogenase (short-subunit alcohol dehydrogenase family)
MIDARPAVLVIGGSGVFGAHLCRRLARLKLYFIYVGGRNRSNAAGLLEDLNFIDPGCEARFVPADRNKVTAAELKWLGIAAVVDAAGPFQGSSYRLPEAAINAGIHYIDLSDARVFTAGIGALDKSARTAGVAVLTGASSTPALSNAMLRDLTAGWQSIDRIWVSIVPGSGPVTFPRSWRELKSNLVKTNTPGYSVIEAILSWAGEPVRVFDDARWQFQTGWGGNRKVLLGYLGWRRTALAETPDLDVLVSDFHPRLSARFHAGVEIGIMHNGLRLFAALRRSRLVPRLTFLTNLLHSAAQAQAFYGSGSGGMVVEADGINAKGEAVQAAARLIALNGHGPVIPALSAVAILKRMASADFDFRGASHAGRHITASEVLELVPDLAIRLETETKPRVVALFKTVLGREAFAALPQVTQDLHRGAPAVLGKGRADIDAPETIAGRVISALFRFPKPGKDVPVSVLVEQTQGGERWLRRYPGREMKSFMSHPDPGTQSLEERFGPFSFRMKISGREDGLDMHMVSARMGPLPLPKFMTPKIKATERTNPIGEHLFDVSISLPLIGRIVHYAGWLTLE